MNNSWTTQIFQILHDKHGRKFLFKGKFLSRLPKPVELSHEWVLKIFKYHYPEFYSRLFYESEKRNFEVAPGSTKKNEK